MTLIAAFVFGGCPIILGDALISKETYEEGVEVSIPTIHMVNQAIVGNKALTVCGSRQKVNLISEKLCVAWSGSYIYAKSFMNYLREHASRATITADEYNLILDSYPAEDLGDLCLISYFYDGKGFWRRDRNAPMFDLDALTDIQVAGSGTPAFVQAIEMISSGHLSGNANALEAAIGKGLLFISHAFGNQLATGAGILDAWGGTFEMAYVRRGAFEKLSDVMQLFWEVSEEETGDLSCNLLPCFVKSTYQKDRLVNLVCDWSTENSNDRLYVIDPVFDRFDDNKVSVPGTEYRWLVNFFLFRSGPRAGTQHVRVNYFGSGDQPIVIQLTDSEYRFAFRDDFTQSMIKSLTEKRQNPA